MYSYFFAYSECAPTTAWWTCSCGNFNYYESCNVCFYTFQLEGSFVHTYYPVWRTWTAYCFKRIACAIIWHHTVFQARILHATRNRLVLKKNDIILRWTRTLSISFMAGIVQREVQKSRSTIAHPGVLRTVAWVEKHIFWTTPRY